MLSIKRWKVPLLGAFLTLLVGGLSSLLAFPALQQFNHLLKPPASPPAFLFPIVWTFLYLLIGGAAGLIFEEISSYCSFSLRLYLVQLIVNILWPLWFFTFGFYLVAFLWLLILWILAFITMILFFREYFISGLLFVPYFLWITFAGYLNFGVWLLNN